MKESKPQSKPNPIVSICCTVFNHEKYLEQTFKGFLSQKVNFPFEIVINDDCSTDGSAEIIRKYEKKFPDIIKPIYQKENQHSKGVRPMAQLVFPRARGKYIALCEGDDYWTDPDKLQKQVDFLESHTDYSMCCTNFSIIDEDGKLIQETGWGKDKSNPVITHLHMLEYYTPKFLTSVMRRSAIPVPFPDQIRGISNGDTFLFSYVALSGPARFIDINTGCYRVNRGGVWSMKSESRRNEMKYNTFVLLKSFYTKPEQQKAINARLSRAHLINCRIALKNGKIFSGLKHFFKSLYLSRKPFKDLFNLSTY